MLATGLTASRFALALALALALAACGGDDSVDGSPDSGADTAADASVADASDPAADASTDDPATAAPADMHRFVVSVGGLDPDGITNWVRLATYTFDEVDGVAETHWHWTQRRRDLRSYTGITATGGPARECNVQTAAGFESATAPLSLQGSYEIDGSILRITWEGEGDIWEEWTVSEPVEGKLSRLTFRGSNFTATHGFGYGSNADWSARTSLTDIAAMDHEQFEHIAYLWKTTTAGGEPFVEETSGNRFYIADWSACESGPCATGLSGSQTHYYLAHANPSATDRRDTLWHWRQSLADSRGEYCYTGNSHVKPMLQIQGSDGDFYGWVGVEASLNQTVPAEGELGDDLGVFIIAEASTTGS